MVFEPSDDGITIGADKAREPAKARQAQMRIKERIVAKTKENACRNVKRKCKVIRAVKPKKKLVATSMNIILRER